MKALRVLASVVAVVAWAGVAGGAPYNFSGTITNPNATIPAGDYGNLIGDGGFGWQTGATDKDVVTNGFTFTLDSGNGNALDYRGVISGAGDVHFLMAPSWSGLANNPMYLSGTAANTYTGTSYVDKGRVEMRRTPGVAAIPGEVVIGGQGNNDRLRWGASDQVADSAFVTLLSSFVATVDLNGYTDTVGGLQLSTNGVVQTGAGGILTTGSLNYDGTWLAAGAYTSASQPFITGTGSVVVLGTTPPAGDKIGLNFAGANNNPGGRKVLAALTVAGAPTFEQSHWNNTPGTAQTGTPSSANDTLLNLTDSEGFMTSLDITFTSPQTWGHNFGATPTGDQQLNGNGITDGTPTITVSQIPLDVYDVVVYMGIHPPGRNSTYLLNDGTNTYERYVDVPPWGDFDVTGWVEVSDLAVTAALRERGNYTVFEKLRADSFTLTVLGGGGVNAIQIVEYIPEPSTLCLLGFGLLAQARRRSRRPRR